MASTIAVTGWFSAKVRTTDGIDSVGKLLGFLQILPGSRLVEENDLRISHKAQGDVEPAAHTARISRRLAVGGVCQAEAFKHVNRHLTRVFEVSQLGNHNQIFPSGQYFVHDGEERREEDYRALKQALDAAAKETYPIPIWTRNEHRRKTYLPYVPIEEELNATTTLFGRRKTFKT